MILQKLTNALFAVISLRALLLLLRCSQGDAMSMPAPAPRSRLLTSGAGGASKGSPMDTGDVVDGVDFGSLAGGVGGDKGDEGR